MENNAADAFITMFKMQHGASQSLLEKIIHLRICEGRKIGKRVDVCKIHRTYDA